MGFFTADLCDNFSDKTEVLGANFQSYGGNRKFKGEVITVKLDKNNKDLATLLKDNADIEKCLFVVDRKDLDRQTREEFNKLNSEIASLKAANSMAFEKGRKQGIEEAKTGGKIVAQRTLYCWKHGTGGHHGNMCDEMSKNNKANYTNQQSDCPDGAAPS